MINGTINGSKNPLRQLRKWWYFLRAVLRKKLNRILCHSRQYCLIALQRTAKKFPKASQYGHIYPTGMTGSGKSSLLLQHIYRERRNSRHNNDRCLIVLDPHGDMVETVRRFDLAHRYFNRMVYADPVFSKDYVSCLNVFELESIGDRTVELHTEQLVKCFQDMLPDAKLSNYMRALLKPCLTTLLHTRTASLEDLQDFMNDKVNAHRVAIGKRSANPAHRKFFTDAFMSHDYARTKISLFTKLQSLLNTPSFRQFVVGRSTINLEQCIRTGKVVLFNLSKGKLGEEVSQTIGRMIIARVKSIALQRANFPRHRRTPIYLIIDEADTFLTGGGDSLEVILQEARKYGLYLVLCTQNLISGKGQERLRHNVLNNTKVKIIGMNGRSTLKPLADETGMPYSLLRALRPHQFRMVSRDRLPKLCKPIDVFGKGSALLQTKGQVQSLHHRIVKDSSYYKPRISTSIHPQEWVDELPRDMHEVAFHETSPSPKFNL